VLELRHILKASGLSLEHAGTARPPAPPASDMLVVVDHHATRIFDVAAIDEGAHVIEPHDPHHFLHHLTHKDQSRERGQRAPEEAAYYEMVASWLAPARRIVVIGHGEGKSNAAHHLLEALKARHPETWQRVVREIVIDLSAATPPQILGLAREALAA
jgi:hypothetical protein